MAIVKCQNPQCDYFQKPVPEGDYCPFCGEPLPTKQSSSPQTPTPPIHPTAQPSIAPPPPISAFSSEEDSPPTVFEETPFPYPTLKLIHTSGKEFSVIPGQKAYIGRRGGQKKPHPEIDLTDIPYSERVSRPHAHIFWDEQAKHFIIVDNQSTNGTIINGDYLKPWHPYPLNDGTILELGKEHYVKFTVQIRS